MYIYARSSSNIYRSTASSSARLMDLLFFLLLLLFIYLAGQNGMFPFLSFERREKKKQG
jgi:hypothetical protein